jgi:two-component system, OmpR family, sensor histidine kinase CreC
VKIRTQIFLSFLILISLVLYFFVDWIVDDVKPRYRESTEDSLADTAIVLSAFAGAFTQKDTIDVAAFRKAFLDVKQRQISAKIYEFLKTNVDLRVYITNRTGLVIFDSDNGRDEGKDYSSWIDVKRTLQGEYGARTSRDDPNYPNMSILYVAAPIFSNGELVGVLTAAKPTQNANLLIRSAESKIIQGSFIVFVIVLILIFLFSINLSRPIDKLIEYAQAIRDGKRVSLPQLGKNEVAKLGLAFEEMRQTLEGKKYIEQYVQTLTHEIKSPLSGIRAAAELLQGNLPPEDEKRFLGNILNDSHRIQALIEKMLLLSSLQTKQKIDDKTNFLINEFLEDIKKCLESQLIEKKITLNVQLQDNSLSISADKFFLKQAILNLLQNAIEFSSKNSQITLEAKVNNKQLEFIVTDQGTGIPDYAMPRIFESFYSLKRQDSGQKSSGLGLTLVKEVAELHGGDINIKSSSPGGTVAIFSIPKTQ